MNFHTKFIKIEHNTADRSQLGSPVLFAVHMLKVRKGEDAFLKSSTLESVFEKLRF